VPGESATVELSVIVPCYNEEDNLPELVERTERVFERRRIRGEIVLVNDASRDGTAAQIEALAERHPCVVGVHHPTNRGIPAAWKSGFERSRGRYVCTIDADLQYQPEAIAHLYREMCFSKADLVQGWRSTLERQHDHRYYWSRGLDHLLKLAFAMPEYDVKSGFVLYRREVFEDILQESGRFHYFQHMITVVAKAKGYAVRQVETLFAERHAGQSFIGGFPLKMMSRTLVDIGRAFLDYRVREPKDQTLEATLATHGGAAVAASRTPAPARESAHLPGISRNAPRYLEELRRTQWLPRAELEQLQLRRLRRLVGYASDHVGYWRELLETAGVTADDIRRLDDLRRIPILTKSTLRENIYFDLLSDSSEKRKIMKVTTSGNTGEPLAVFVDPLQRDMRWANAMRHREWAGWRPGEARLQLGRAPAGDAAGGVQALGQRLRAALIPDPVVTADAIDPAFVRDLEQRIERERPVLLEADAEVLGSVAGMRTGDAAAPWTRALISTGQTLEPEMRALIERRLGARVFDRYGAREFGPLAQQCEAGGWHVNVESVIVEVERDGRPAAPGEEGELLVTDLNNRCVPLLRYRLGGGVVASDRACPCGRGLPLLERIGGRAAGVIVGDAGRQVPAGFFADLFGDYEFAVSRWQVEQPARDRVVVRLVQKSRFTGETAGTIGRLMRTALGASVAVDLTVVETIPVGPGEDARPFVPLPGSVAEFAPEQRSHAAE
jgi:phenylacetate-coenzyme A ligase PaaK-like adenylate-forming protein